MPPRRQFRGRGGRTIDFKQWAAAPGSILSSAAEGTFVVGSLAFLVPATILRWRGYVSAMFDETAQPGDQAAIAWGIGVFSTDAVAVGATALPDPGSEPEFPWVWYGEMFLQSREATGAGNPTSSAWGPLAQRIEIDSKGMRKVKPGESVAIVWEVDNAVGAPVIEFDTGNLRVLVGT